MLKYLIFAALVALAAVQLADRAGEALCARNAATASQF